MVLALAGDSTMTSDLLKSVSLMFGGLRAAP